MMPVLADRRTVNASAARARAGVRGAAMPEAVIVITTLLCFLGLILWMRQAYGMKLDLQQQTRSEVLYHASHGCEGDGAVAHTESGGTIAVDVPGGQIATNSGLPEGNAASPTRNSSTGSLSGTANGQAIFDQNASRGGGIRLQKSPLSTTVTASSRCTCNEKKYDNQLTAWIEYGVSLVTSGFVTDLFQ